MPYAAVAGWGVLSRVQTGQTSRHSTLRVEPDFVQAAMQGTAFDPGAEAPGFHQRVEAGLSALGRVFTWRPGLQTWRQAAAAFRVASAAR